VSGVMREAAGAGATVGPIAEHARIEVLDILRGFAIFGILLVNMASFSSAQGFPGYIAPPLEPVDQLVSGLIIFLAEQKFYSLFSLLFGLGFALQFDRARTRGGRFLPTYLRRLLILFGFGVAHAVLLWEGDILALYAVLGVLLVAFRNRAPRTALIGAGLCLLLWLAMQAWLYVLSGIPLPKEADTALGVSAAQWEAVHANGSYVQIAAQRISELLLFWPVFLVVLGPSVFAMFLIGLYLGKRRIFEDLGSHVPLLRRMLRWGLVVGVAGNLAYLLGYNGTRLGFLSEAAIVLGAPALCLFYVAAICLLVQRAGWQRRLTPLAPVGRMALSNYLLQSLVATTIFYGYGLGLFGRVGPVLGLLLTVAIYAVQVLLSEWWMRRFRFGPAEWLWRSLTYARRQPMRRGQPAA
jgi:uncharacterized protein